MNTDTTPQIRNPYNPKRQPQKYRLFELLADEKWHQENELHPIAHRFGARLKEMRDDERLIIETRKDGVIPTLWRYRMRLDALAPIPALPSAAPVLDEYVRQVDDLRKLDVGEPGYVTNPGLLPHSWHPILVCKCGDTELLSLYDIGENGDVSPEYLHDPTPDEDGRQGCGWRARLRLADWKGGALPAAL